jgi:hypothetical protein
LLLVKAVVFLMRQLRHLLLLLPPPAVLDDGDADAKDERAHNVVSSIG